MPAVNTESGLKPIRLEYIEEATQGTTPANPAWKRFSDCAVAAGPWQPQAGIFERRCLGLANPDGFNAGPEDHTLQAQYYLQKLLTVDAFEDGAIRDADNNIRTAHTVVIREERTINVGIDSAGTRLYTVAVGALINAPSLQGQNQDGRPIVIDLQYIAEKIRPYRIDQPTATGVATVVSTSTADTTQSIEIENEGAATNETLALNGTTPVVGIVSFADIDAAFLTAETAGNITITIGGSQMMIIYGSAAYDGAEGDLGVPALGTGSHAAAVGGSYQSLRSATVERPGGTALAFATRDLNINITNGITPEGILGLRKALIAGDQSIQAVATTFGPFESDTRISEHLRVVANPVVVTLGDGTVLTVLAAVNTAPGARVYSLGQGIMQLGNTFTGTGITIA